MAVKVRVHVDGLAELRAKMAKLGNRAEFEAILSPAHHDVGEIVDRDSKARARSRQMRRATQSNRLTFPKGGPTIRIGGASGDARWAIGAQFGAIRYHQFPARIADGYTVIPAVDANVGRIEDRYLDAIEKHL